MRVAKPFSSFTINICSLYIAKIVRVAKLILIIMKWINCLYIAKIVRVAKQLLNNNEVF